MIILYEIAYGVYDAMRIVMTRQAQTHTHTHMCMQLDSKGIRGVRCADTTRDVQPCNAS